MDTESSIAYIKTYDIYKGIAEGVETKLGSSNYELSRPLPKGKNNKVIGVAKNELGGKVMKEFIGLKVKTYSYLIDDSREDKKGKETKKCVIKKN